MEIDPKQSRRKEDGMEIYLEEKIGDPDLFVGRDKQLADLLKWTGNIKKRISMSRALPFHGARPARTPCFSACSILCSSRTTG